MHELGAGLGLAGLVLSKVASTLVLSDFNERVVTNLGENVLLNDGGDRCRACRLDWSNLENAEPWTREPCELIVASDVICCVADALLFAAVVSRLLRPSGAAVVVLPSPENRFGTEAFGPALTAAGLSWESHQISAQRMVSGIEDFLSFDLFVIWWPEASEDAFVDSCRNIRESVR